MTVEQECEQIFEELDRFIKSRNRTTPATRFAKSVGDDDDKSHGEARPYPSTRRGLEEFGKSTEMQQLLSIDPVAFRQQYLNFILDRELVRLGEVTPTEVGSWSHQLEALVDITGRGEVLSKAVTHHESMVRPWDFEPSPRGFQAFLHSDEMQQLERERPAVWRRHHLDFYASIHPAPTAKEVSIKRLELEASHPDRDPGGPTMTKALVPGSHLSHGQSVLTANFGRAIGDPSVWLRPR